MIMTMEMTLFVASEFKFSITELENADSSVPLVLDPSLCRQRESLTASLALFCLSVVLHPAKKTGIDQHDPNSSLVM